MRTDRRFSFSPASAGPPLFQIKPKRNAPCHSPAPGLRSLKYHRQKPPPARSSTAMEPKMIGRGLKPLECPPASTADAGSDAVPSGLAAELSAAPPVSDVSGASEEGVSIELGADAVVLPVSGFAVEGDAGFRWVVVFPGASVDGVEAVTLYPSGSTTFSSSGSSGASFPRKISRIASSCPLRWGSRRSGGWRGSTPWW